MIVVSVSEAIFSFHLFSCNVYLFVGKISRAIFRVTWEAIFDLEVIFIGHIFCGDLWGYFWNASYFSNRIELMYFDIFYLSE